MPIEIQTTDDISVNGVKVVIYGEAGIGKTMLCATAPKPVIISAESGLLSLAGMGIPYIKVKDLQQVGEAFNKVKDTKEFETICIDSLSEIAELLLVEFKKEDKDGRQSYMKMADSVSAMLRKFRDLEGKNIVFTAKMKSREDENSGLISFYPSIPGRVLPESLPYFTDEVFVMRFGKSKAKGEYRYLQTKSDMQRVAKDRSGCLPPSVEVPEGAQTLTEIFDKIKEGVRYKTKKLRLL